MIILLLVCELNEDIMIRNTFPAQLTQVSYASAKICVHVYAHETLPGVDSHGRPSYR
jgi:hypothetical protein